MEQDTVPVPVIGPPLIGDEVAMLVTVPVPGATAHVPSPRQNVEVEAPAPLLRLVMGRLPVTSAFPRFTALEVTVCVAPAKCAIPTPGDDATTQVVQVIVPVEVIGPPPIGVVVAMFVIVPEPVGTAHVPSPRQNVVLPAEVPLFRLPTGRFPVTPVLSGNPVAFVRTPLAGVPSAGVVSVGEVSVLLVSV